MGAERWKCDRGLVGDSFTVATVAFTYQAVGVFGAAGFSPDSDGGSSCFLRPVGVYAFRGVRVVGGLAADGAIDCVFEGYPGHGVIVSFSDCLDGFLGALSIQVRVDGGDLRQELLSLVAVAL